MAIARAVAAVSGAAPTASAATAFPLDSADGGGTANAVATSLPFASPSAQGLTGAAADGSVMPVLAGSAALFGREVSPPLVVEAMGSQPVPRPTSPEVQLRRLTDQPAASPRASATSFAPLPLSRELTAAPEAPSVPASPPAGVAAFGSLSVSAPGATVSRVGALNPSTSAVQRADDLSPAAPAAEVAEASVEAPAPAQTPGMAEQDLDKLTEKVWQRIRRMLQLERERRRGLP